MTRLILLILFCLPLIPTAVYAPPLPESELLRHQRVIEIYLELTGEQDELLRQINDPSISKKN